MREGFDITFREVMPESSIIELVVAQIAQLHGVDDRHCSVVLRRTLRAADEFAVRVQLAPEFRGDALHGEATGHDPYEAVRRAFADLRAHQQPLTHCTVITAQRALGAASRRARSLRGSSNAK